VEAHAGHLTQPTAIHPATTIGAVRLIVANPDRARAFYERVLGLRTTERADGLLSLSAGGPPLVELRGDRSARPLDTNAPGLFHQAILMPDRQSLAMALARVAAAGWPLTGASDHLVSEALYLTDPEGNGIEIYRDRPRKEWTYQDGQLAMSTLPLDLDNLLGELSDLSELPPEAPPDTRMGHVHLQVSDLKAAENFYSGVLGLDVTVRGYPGALFVSAGGYHHHLGLNTWHSRGAEPRQPGSVGLDRFEIVVPDATELERRVEHARSRGAEIEPEPEGWLTRDPSGNRVLLRAA
jgi:catechol 2,3-dioxygenase